MTKAESEIRRNEGGAWKRPPIPLLAATILFELFAGFLCINRYGIAAFSIYLLAAVGFIAIVLYSWDTFIARHRTCAFGQGSPTLLAKIVVIDFIFALVLELGTLIGAHTFSPVRITDWHLGRILVFFYFALVVSALVSAYAPQISIRSQIESVVNWRRNTTGRTFPTPFVALIVYLVTLALSWLLAKDGSISWIAIGTILAAVLICIGAIALAFFEKRWTLEKSFAYIALAIGLAFILPFPATNLFSWDDEVHYRNANALSYIANVELTSSDRMIIKLFALEDGFSRDATFGRYQEEANTWSARDISQFSTELNNNHSAESTQVTSGISYILMQFNFIGYIPSACALWLGRLLHLPFSITFALGRIANLISYVAVVYLAIKKIPCKKVLLAVFALLPTNIFLAANYSYDAWLTSWLLLAVALTIREIKETGYLPLKTWVGMLLVYLFALGPKAIYFPLMALMMLIPSQRFGSKQRKNRLYLLAIGVALLVVATFALSFLASGGGEGDARSGNGASGTEQLSYVLANPLTFVQTLLSFVFGEYLTFANFAFAFTALAYLGYPSLLYPVSAAILVVFVLIVSLAEGSSPGSALLGIGKKLWTLFLCIVIVLLSSAALYFSFTAIGSSTVEGVQPRYMLPLIFPLCALTLNIPHMWKIKERVLVAVCLSVSSVYLLVYTWLMFSSRVVA